jgi:hypothetical protein
MPGVTTANALCAQTNTFDRSVPIDSFLGVLRAGGIKAALIANKQAQAELIQGYKF